MSPFESQDQQELKISLLLEIHSTAASILPIPLA